MDPNNKKDQKNNQNRNRNMRGVVTLIIWALVLTVVFNYINAYSNNLTKRASSHEIPYSQLIDLIQEDQVAELKIENGVLYATPVDGYVYTEEATDKNKEPKSYTQSEKTPLILYTTALNDASLLPLLEEHNVKYTSPVQTQMSPILEFMITYVLPVIVLAALFMLVMRIMAKNGGIGGIGSVGKSNAKVYMEKSTGVTFKDVAGQDEAKESLEEIIDFLHNPQKYTAIGAILPKGALGYTLHLPEEEKFLMSREDILAEIRTLLAGRSSEEVVCHTMTSGAANDIERATEMARNLVARFGMCEEFDMMALGSVQNQYLDGTYSMSCAQETYAAADRAVIAIIRQCHEDARRMLEENRELLDKIAAYLLKKETITGQEMMAIIEGRDPETVDNYGATREEKQPLFRPSSPEVIEAPAKHIHIVSEPVPSPEEPQTPEEKSPEEAQPDRDPEESEQK